MEDELNKMKEEAIKEALREHKKADSSLPLSSRDKELQMGDTPESEYLKIEKEAPRPNGYNGTMYEGKTPNNPVNRQTASSETSLFGGGLSSLLKSNDLLLYALAFLLFNEKADDDLLLAIIYIMMGK